MNRNHRLLGAVVVSAAALSVGTAAIHTAPADAATYAVHGIDVSANQLTDTATINWSTVVKHENFAFIKATEGDNYTSKYLAKGWPQMKAVGIPRAPYHFMLSSDAGTPLQQAQYFIANVKAIGYTGKHAGELPPALDFEWDERTKKCPTGLTNAGIKQFVDAVRSAFGRNPIIYTNNNFLKGCGFDSRVFAANTFLWQSDYQHSTPPISPGWSTVSWSRRTDGRT